MTTAPSAAGHAFISYVHEDSELVDGLCNVLDAAGIAVWRDREQLWPGDEWKVQIRRAIQGGSLAFIACFSEQSVARNRSYQNEELILAVDEYRMRPPGRPWLFPVRFNDVDLPELDLGAGRTLGELQRADLFGPNREREITRLAISISRILNASPNVPIPSGSTSEPSSAKGNAQAVADPLTPRAGILASNSTNALNWDGSIERLITFKDWNYPLLIWQSMPLGSVDLLSRMWGRNSISEVLSRPASLRSNGFNWYFLTQVSQFSGGALASDGRRAIWISANGVITAAATATDDMLGWAMHNSPGQPQRLNVIAVAELTLEYFRLVDETILPGTNTRYVHSIATRKFADEPPVVLAPGAPNTFSSFSAHGIGEDARHEFAAAIPVNPERDAFEALWRLYSNFQLGPDAVPFAKQDRIDTQEFLEWLKTHR
jgi:hypothetical protein